MNVLSLFDGIACGLVALKRSGIKVDNYFASEIDKYAIQIAKKNHPEIIHLGDVKTFDLDSLPKIDILIGGSPCQGFSNAGKGLNFDDPRSKLFFCYVYILEELKEKNPKIKFLFENVRMKKEWQDVISGYLGCEPIKINSALVSAQNRVRLYWTNIQEITPPEDKHIYLKDIIECGEVDREKSYTIDANYFKGGNPRSYFENGKRQLIFENQPQKRATVKIQGAAIRNQITKRGREEQLNIRKDEKSNAVVPSYPNKLNRVSVKTIGHGYVPESEKEMSKYPSLCGQSPRSKHLIQAGVANGIKGKEQWRRVYSPAGKAPTVVGSGGGHHEPKVALDLEYYRKLTPLECERLQTLPECDIMDSLWLHIMNLSNQNKTCVPVEISSGKLIKPVGIAERNKFKVSAKLVEQSFTINNPLSEFTARLNADIKIDFLILKCISDNQEELNWCVNNAENLLQFHNQESEERRKEVFALLDAFIGSIQVKIVVNGLEVLHLRDKNLFKLKSGETLLNRYGKEIISPVDGVIYINPKQNIPTIFTTLSPLLLAERVERIQTILSFYVSNAIDGYTLRQILIDGCWTCPKTNKPIEIQGYTSSISNTQRYKCIGNGWTVDVISHIFSFMKVEK